MTNRTLDTFNAHAGTYNADRRRLIPPFDSFYGTAVDALVTPKTVLDLGAGTGLLSRFVRAAYPDAELTLLDGAEAMLEGARATFGDSVSYVQADLTDPLPEGPWC